MNDNVKAFPGAADLPENPMQVAPRHPGWCSHKNVILDQHTRTIQCADIKCGAALDPFDFLLKQAATIQDAWGKYRSVMTEVSSMVERVGVLKKEEQRLRAMIKRLQDKSGSVVNTRGIL